MRGIVFSPAEMVLESALPPRQGVAPRIPTARDDGADTAARGRAVPPPTGVWESARGPCSPLLVFYRLRVCAAPLYPIASLRFAK